MSRRDPYLHERVRTALAEGTDVGEQDIRILIVDDRIMLSGHVGDEGQLEVITRVVQAEAPDHVVCNEIDVVHLSEPDREQWLT
jgi:hypothetical protein